MNTGDERRMARLTREWVTDGEAKMSVGQVEGI